MTRHVHTSFPRRQPYGKRLPGVATSLTFGLMLVLSSPLSGQEGMTMDSVIPLPAPVRDGAVSLERTLAQRRSVRSFAPDPLTLPELSQLLWAAQGITRPMESPPAGFTWQWMGGLRTTPSAGALYPLEIYVVAGAVQELETGTYRYLPREHGLLRVAPGDLREPLWDAALRQTAIRTAPVTLVLAAVVERTAAKYGDRAERYVHMEVGAASENVYLQCESLGLGTVFMGAFRDEAVATTLALPDGHRPLGIMPVGHGAEGS